MDIACPYCHVQGTVPEDYRGKPIRCNKCNRRFITTDQCLPYDIGIEAQCTLNVSNGLLETIPFRGYTQSGSYNVRRCLSRDGKYYALIASSHSTSAVSFFDAASLSPLCELSGGGDASSCLFSDSSHYFFLGSKRGYIRVNRDVWAEGTGLSEVEGLPQLKRVSKVDGYSKHPIKALACTRDGERTAFYYDYTTSDMGGEYSSSHQNLVYLDGLGECNFATKGIPDLVWSGDSAKQKKITDLQFSPNGAYLAGLLRNNSDRYHAPRRDDSIVVWDVATKHRICTFTYENAAIDAIQFSPDSKLLYSVGKSLSRRELTTTLLRQERQSVCAWHLELGKQILFAPTESDYDELCVVSDGLLLVARKGKSLDFICSATGQRFKKVEVENCKAVFALDSGAIILAVGIERPLSNRLREQERSGLGYYTRDPEWRDFVRWEESLLRVEMKFSRPRERQQP